MSENQEFKPRQTPSQFELRNSRSGRAVEKALKLVGILILGALGIWALLHAIAFAFVASLTTR